MMADGAAGYQVLGGQQAAPLTLDNAAAIRAWNLLANGMGGLDWAGLPVVAAVLGIADIESLVDALGVIKAHRPGADDGPAPPDTDDVQASALDH